MLRNYQEETREHIRENDHLQNLLPVDSKERKEASDELQRPTTQSLQSQFIQLQRDSAITAMRREKVEAIIASQQEIETQRPELQKEKQGIRLEAETAEQNRRQETVQVIREENHEDRIRKIAEDLQKVGHNEQEAREIGILKEIRRESNQVKKTAEAEGVEGERANKMEKLQKISSDSEEPEIPRTRVIMHRQAPSTASASGNEESQLSDKPEEFGTFRGIDGPESRLDRLILGRSTA